jgi:hypothetical protein
MLPLDLQNISDCSCSSKAGSYLDLSWHHHSAQGLAKQPHITLAVHRIAELSLDHGERRFHICDSELKTPRDYT